MARVVLPIKTWFNKGITQYSFFLEKKLNDGILILDNEFVSQKHLKAVQKEKKKTEADIPACFVITNPGKHKKTRVSYDPHKWFNVYDMT